MDGNNMPQIKSLSNLPFSFEENIGQMFSQVKFFARQKGYTAFFTPTEVIFTLRQGRDEDRFINKQENSMQPKVSEPLEQQSNEYSLLKMRMEGSNPNTEIIGEEKLEGKFNYFIGSDTKKWVANVPTYERVRYKEIYPGIDLVYYGKVQQLEHDFIVKPSADPEIITLSFEGAENVEVDAEGNLLVQAKIGKLRLLKPIVYQDINGNQQEIESSYEIRSSGEVGFLLGEYNKSMTLRIDPVLSYSTFLGESNGEIGYGITADVEGNAYITGTTASNNFPTTEDAYDRSFNGVFDVFITKLNPSGTELVYSTFLGGAGDDIGYAITIDAEGNAYITGTTASDNFPTTDGAYDRSFNGNYDVFITKLNSSGTALVYSTFLGGAGTDSGNAIAIDAEGNAYITGETNDDTFPTTEGAYNGSINGGIDAFVTKLNSSGTALVYSTFLGGEYIDIGSGIAIDEQGNAYITGQTFSSNFPTTQGAYDTTYNKIGYYDAFVTKLHFSGTKLVYSTFLGGNHHDVGKGIAIDAEDNAYITGYTRSSNFPTTQGAYDTTQNNVNYYDAFVTKLNFNGTGLVYSTFLGGTNDDRGYGIVIDTAGNAYITGRTLSSNFPTTEGAYDRTYNGASYYDAFVTKLNSSGSKLVYSTYLGGSYNDYGNGIAIDAAGNIYITGQTNSNNFPTTEGAYDIIYNGRSDAFSDVFVTKFVFNVLVPNYNITTLENTPVDGTVVGKDPDGYPLIYSLLSDASNGTALVKEDGTWTYTPEENYYGTDSFSVLVDNGNGGSAISIINITVNRKPSAPYCIVKGTFFVTIIDN